MCEAVTHRISSSKQLFTAYMQLPLSHKAIECALTQNWKEAVRINIELLKDNQEDVDALNRLAYAHLKLSNLSTSKTTYKRVLKIDKYNPIALKNLKWLENLKKEDIQSDPSISPTPMIFLEEPGKTKIVLLVHLAPTRTLCNVGSAQRVFLVPRKHSIEIRTLNNAYIGALPDDLAYRLLKFIAAGNTYDAYVKSVARNMVVIFIRELTRGKKYSEIPSFFVFTNGFSQKNKKGAPLVDEDVINEGSETN